MDGTELPQFRGTDSKECEEFIAAVVKHAYNQGKLRDDEWIADFTASCFVHDALRWWSWLDRETRGSWELLRQAMFSRYRPLFHGKNGEEAEQFVFSVCQRALDAGKENDNDWIIASVSGSFAGNALRWRASLDSSIRKNWDLLEVAILAQYPREDQSGPLLKMPTPAAAASAPPRTNSRGRIRLLKKNDSTVFYLSKDSGSCIGLTTSLGNALEVEYNPSSSSPHQLLIPDGQTPHYDALGARWSSVNPTTANYYAYICGVNLNNGSTSLSESCLMTNMWCISLVPSDATQLLPVSAVNGTVPLITRGKKDVECIWFRIAPYAGDPDVDVDLFFEPV